MDMSQSTDVDDKPIYALVEASEVLRSLNPSLIASFLYLIEDTDYTQAEIGNRIGYSGTTVSQCFQSLEAAPLQLATKHGQRYEVTTAGEALIGHLNGMADRLGVELQSLDWQSDTAHDQVTTVLTPLYDSRGTIPFFVLNSINARSVEGDRTDRRDTPQQVWVGDVIQDVKSRQQERGERTTSSQIYQVIYRFDDKGAIELEGDRITLTEKGQEHAALLERVVELIEEQSSVGDDRKASHTAARWDDTDADWPVSRERKDESDSLINQTRPQRFLGNRVSMDNRGVGDRPSVVPVYCLRPEGDESDESSSNEDVSPVLPFAPLTIGELTDRIRELGQEYDMDTELEPYWMVRMGPELYPVEPANTHSEDDAR